MSLKSIDPDYAHELIQQGAVLVDIRAADEYAREHIAQAINITLADLNGQKTLTDSAGIVFHCRSGNRTLLNTVVLSSCVECNAYIMKGGLDAWKRSGFTTILNTSRPIELNRQVQITAGSIILLGTILGVSISPWFYALSAFVGAGLIFAGISGFCGLARLLMIMPWNRKA